MFGLITNLTKAAVAIAVAPVAIVADIVCLPADAEKINKPAFSRTGKLLKSAGDNISKAVDPDDGL